MFLLSYFNDNAFCTGPVESRVSCLKESGYVLKYNFWNFWCTLARAHTFLVMSNRWIVLFFSFLFFSFLFFSFLFFFFLKERRWTKVNIRAEAKNITLLWGGQPNHCDRSGRAPQTTFQLNHRDRGIKHPLTSISKLNTRDLSELWICAMWTYQLVAKPAQGAWYISGS